MARGARRRRVLGRARDAAGDGARRRRTSCPRRSRWRRPAGPSASGRARCARCSASTARRPASARSTVPPGPELESVRELVRTIAAETGRPIRLLVGKPGLDGHSNGAEQIAVAARDAGLRGHLPGHPADARPRSRPPPATRTSTWSGSRSSPARTSGWCPRRCGCCGRRASTRRSWSAASSRTPTGPQLEAMGVARVYTPKDYRLSRMMRDLAELARVHRSKPQAGAAVSR